MWYVRRTTSRVCPLVTLFVAWQVERLAQTAPEMLYDLRLLTNVSQLAGQLLGSFSGYLSSLSGAVAAERTRLGNRDQGALGDRYDDEANASSAEDLELKQFDRQLLEREARRKRGEKE
jgi:hypothetical protein